MITEEISRDLRDLTKVQTHIVRSEKLAEQAGQQGRHAMRTAGSTEVGLRTKIIGSVEEILFETPKMHQR
jgi:hypothetical protein